MGYDVYIYIYHVPLLQNGLLRFVGYDVLMPDMYIYKPRAFITEWTAPFCGV